VADVVVAIVAVVTGTLLCARGSTAVRAALPAAAGFGGFLLGAGGVQYATGSPMLRSAQPWLVGVAAGVLLAACAHRWFEVATTTALTVAGFVSVVAALAALGAAWSVPAVATGAVVGLLLGVLCIVADLANLLFVALTAVAGASMVLFGLVLLAGSVGTADLAMAGTIGRLTHRPVWSVLWLVLAVAGGVVQVRTMARTTLRDRFVDAGGHQIRET